MIFLVATLTLIAGVAIGGAVMFLLLAREINPLK